MKYFGVVEISADQVDQYAQRKVMSQAKLERWLAPNLGCEPEQLALIDALLAARLSSLA